MINECYDRIIAFIFYCLGDSSLGIILKLEIAGIKHAGISWALYVIAFIMHFDVFFHIFIQSGGFFLLLVIFQLIALMIQLYYYCCFEFSMIK